MAARMMLALKPPASPLSAVTITTRIAVALALREQRVRFRLGARGHAGEHLEHRRAKGRAANIASWARRSFAAETIFMALVICCVLLTDLIRRRMSTRAGMRSRPSAPRSRAGRRRRTPAATAFSWSVSSPFRSFFSAMSFRSCGMARLEEGVQLLLVAPRLGDRERVEVAVGGGEEDRDLLLDGQRASTASASGSRPGAGRGPASTAWPCRGRRRTWRRRRGRGTARGRGAGGRPRPSWPSPARTPPTRRHRVADVDGGPDAGVEEVALQEDLAVGDGDDVGRDVGRDVAGLGLDDGQRGEAARALLVVQLRRALEQAAVQVEDVAGVGLASGRPPQEQRDLAVGRGVFATGRRRRRARACRCRGSTRRWRSRRRARCRGRARARWRWRRPRWCGPSRRSPRASSRPGPPSTASGRWRRRCRRRSCPSG